jgi:hypothetical protein
MAKTNEEEEPVF